MKIILADTAGFCAGVKNIDKKVRESIDNLDNVYSFGQLIHNKDYTNWARENGLREIDSLDQVEEGSNVIIRAHGIEKEKRKKIASKANLIDGTCPILLAIYKDAINMYNNGYKIIIIGDKDHPEIIAMNSYIDNSAIIINSIEEAKEIKDLKNIFVISQTTNIREKYDSILELLRKQNINVKNKVTICNATKIRQEECKALSKRVDFMIVIGGKNSSNTDKLYQIAKENAPRAIKIENLSELSLQNVVKFNTIGVTAGASTPAWIIEEVVVGMDNFNEEFMEKVEDSMIKIYPKDIVKGTVINVKEDEVFVDIKFRSDGIVKFAEMTDEEQANPLEAFHEGDEIDVYVIKLDDGEGNVSLSTRRVEGLKNWKKLAEKFEKDEVVEVQVTGSNTGGLVVQAMGINGFIPASHIATYYVKNFKKFVGQKLDAKIISIDERKRRVVFSSKVVVEEQLNEVWDNIEVGETVKGKVVRMTDFGAFVDLGGVDGLIHVSDIAWSRIEKPSDVLEIGQEVEPVVLKANRAKNRISLGLKQLQPKPFDLFIQNNKEGDVVKGTVVNLVDFGAFVRLNEGVEGLVHVSEIAHEHVNKPSDALNKGDEIEVKILDIDEEEQRIALSMKALIAPPPKTEITREERDRLQEKRNERNKNRQKAKENVEETNDFSESGFGNSLGDLIELKIEEEKEEEDN